MIDITSLTPFQQKLMCNLAYSGVKVDRFFYKDYAKKFKTTQKALQKEVEKLSSMGLLEESNTFWHSTDDRVISDNYRMDFLLLLHTEHEDWLNDIIVPNKYSENARTVVLLNNIVLSLIKSRKELTKAGITIDYNGGDWRQQPQYTVEQKSIAKSLLADIQNLTMSTLYYLPFLKIDDPFMLPFIAKQNSEIIDLLFNEFLNKDIVANAGKILCIINHLIELFDIRMSKLDNIIGNVCACIYFCSGKMVFDHYKLSDKNYYHLMCQGFRQAYEGNTSSAIKNLESAITLRNKTVNNSQKGAFGEYLSNYLLTVTYAKDGSEKSRKKLESLQKKSNFINNINNIAAKVIARYFMDEKQEIDMNTLIMSFKNNLTTEALPGAMQLLYLVICYLNIDTQKLGVGKQRPIMDPDYYLPDIMILRHELADYIHITPEEKQLLTETFGGKPLLTSIRIKQPWEIILESIYEAEVADNNSGSDNAEVQARGIYVMNIYNERIEIKEQSRLKNGAWGRGKRLSLSTFDSGNYEMDELDQKIQGIYRNRGMFPYLSSIVPFLVGTDDRLYIDDHGYNMEPVSVVEQKPFISIDKKKDGIVVSSNMPLKKLDNKQVYEFDEHNLRITYFPMEGKEKLYLKQLLSMGKMPLYAEETLQKVMPLISKKVEIHTDFIEGTQTLKEENGIHQLCVRIMPSNGFYIVHINVIPLKGGKAAFNPGEGKRIIFDERDGEHYQVKRNLSVESANRLLIEEFLSEMDIIDESQPYNLSPIQVVDLMDFIHENPDIAYIEWPEGEKIHLSIAQPGSWNISLKSKSGWFDLEGDVQIDDDTVIGIAELMDLVSASRSRFIKLGEDQYLALSESLRKQIQRLSAVATSQRGKMKIPAVGAALLGDALSGELTIKHPKAIDELRTKIRKSAKLQPAVPDALNATLREYQLDGYQWMARLDSWGAGACLSDDMGLGKTVQAITFMLDKRDDGPLLIVAPASVVPNWRNELHRFAPSLNVVVLNEEADRTAAIVDADAGTVILTTYGLLITQEEAITEKQWGCICLDEAHTIKNRDTKTSAVCMKMQSKHRIILTGTPLQNHLGELWNLFQFINPGLLGSYEQFQKKFITPIEAGDNEEKRQLLKRIIKPFMLRRTKQEVATELPDKEDIRLHIDLSDDEMGVYEVIRRRAKDELESLEQTGKKVNMNTLAEITRLRMAACSAQLAEKKWKGRCSKLDAFTNLVQELQQNGHRALVFSQFTSFLEMARKRLDDAKIDYFYLDGSTPMAKREKMVKEFQKGKNNVFLISLKAGGLGLNLTGANYVIHLDPWWNPAIEQQATDRAHRIGQKEKVTVYHLVSANTIEEKILRLHEQKRDLADSLLDGTNQSHKITAKQLLEMLETK